jgi:hypothetical protein
MWWRQRRAIIAWTNSYKLISITLPGVLGFHSVSNKFDDGAIAHYALTTIECLRRHPFVRKGNYWVDITCITSAKMTKVRHPLLRLFERKCLIKNIKSRNLRLGPRLWKDLKKFQNRWWRLARFVGSDWNCPRFVPAAGAQSLPCYGQGVPLIENLRFPELSFGNWFDRMRGFLIKFSECKES